MKHGKWKQKSLLLLLIAVSLVTAGCPASHPLQQHTFEDPVPVTIEVIDSVGGSFIAAQSVLTVYEHGNTVPVWNAVPITGGKLNLILSYGKTYDLELAGRKNVLAASVLENYPVRTRTAQTITMIQRVPQMGADIQAPSIERITLNNRPFTDGAECTGGSHETLEVIFYAASRAVQQAPKAGNFGCAFAIGSSASSLNNITAASIKSTMQPNGIWKCIAQFDLSSVIFLNETDDMSITAYDLAGNRVERRINAVTFKEKRPAPYTLKGAIIKNFRVEMHRYPHSMRTYNVYSPLDVQPAGLERHRGRSTSSQTQIWFLIKNPTGDIDIPIRGFDIYRREQGTAEWKLTTRKKYNGESTGFRSNDPQFTAQNGYHFGYDTDNSLTEGTVYEYKIIVYGGTDERAESYITSASLLPACSILLEYPADSGTVKKSELASFSLSFRLTNPSLWEQKKADFFSFGVLITDRTSDESVIFAGKISIALKAPQGKQLLLNYTAGTQTKSLTLAEIQEAGLIDGSITENDLINYKDGVITLKPAYLRTGGFNHPHYAGAQMKAGHTYSWDIFDWGADPLSPFDNEPAAFASMWYHKNADGAALKTKPFSTSESFANILRSAGSLNGHTFFTVTNE
ncbi:MAG: dentilisin complex subunit PrcA [Treponema sp.]